VVPTPRPVPTPQTTPTPTAPVPAPTPAPSPATPGQTLFDDEFNGSSVSSQWTLLNRPGDHSNNEVGCYQPGNISEGSGVLNIHTQVAGACPGYGYTSGMVQWAGFRYTYGTLEVRARMPGGQGPWPAVWMLGADCQTTNPTTPDNVGTCHWPHDGSQEIDVAEKLCGDSCVNQQLWADAGNTMCRPAVSDVTANWHTYRLEWKPGSLVWKIDGVQTCSATQGVPSKPMFLMLNTAVGGNGGGTVDASTLPVDFQIDYVRVIAP
jgi:beta-glucanase (GH16 family)